MPFFCLKIPIEYNSTKKLYDLVNKLTPMFLSVFPVIDHEFRRNIFKQDWAYADYFDDVMMKFLVNNRTDALNTDVNLLFTMTNCQFVCSRSLTHCINCKFMCLSVY